MHDATDLKSKQVGAVFLFGEDGGVLMQHRDNRPGIPYADHWSIPSGRKEAGESFEECARREFFEETGYRLTALQPLETVRDCDDVDGNYELYIFWAKDDGRQTPRCLEGQELAFIKRSEASRYRMPSFLLPVWDRAIAGGTIKK